MNNTRFASAEKKQLQLRIRALDREFSIQASANDLGDDDDNNQKLQVDSKSSGGCIYSKSRYNFFRRKTRNRDKSQHRAEGMIAIASSSQRSGCMGNNKRMQLHKYSKGQHRAEGTAMTNIPNSGYGENLSHSHREYRTRKQNANDMSLSDTGNGRRNSHSDSLSQMDYIDSLFDNSLSSSSSSRRFSGTKQAASNDHGMASIRRLSSSSNPHHEHEDTKSYSLITSKTRNGHDRKRKNPRKSSSKDRKSRDTALARLKERSYNNDKHYCNTEVTSSNKNVEGACSA